MEINKRKFAENLKRIFGETETNENVVRLWSSWNNLNMDEALKFLNEKVLNPKFTEKIGSYFSETLLLIISNTFTTENNDNELHLQKCIALSKLLKFSSEIQRFSLMFFSKLPSPFEAVNNNSSKKKKTVQVITNSDIVECCYLFLKSDINFYKNTWNWSKFIDIYCSCDDYKRNTIFQSLCNSVLALLTNMTSTQLNFLNRNIPLEDLIKFESNFITTKSNTNQNESITDIDEKVVWNFKNDVLVNVEGVTLPIFNPKNYSFYEKGMIVSKDIVMVDSTKVNLRSLALGVSAGKAVCLSGPVGSGKTSLVEYLAAKTGRIPPKFVDIENIAQFNGHKAKENQIQTTNEKEKIGPAKKTKRKRQDTESDNTEIDFSQLKNLPNGFLRIQLGDQTDSKMLLGQYRCTDVPGEFVWQPGVLTQAVMHGYWLLLEDLDCCTQDVCTVLTNLLENNYLSVPGFRDALQISAGFQLFITLRTQKCTQTQNTYFQLLEKYLYTINILPLSRTELCDVICYQFPKLATISGRIVDVFLTFSSGYHSLDADEAIRSNKVREFSENSKAEDSNYVFETNHKSGINSGRLVSTRDLMKLCIRSSPTFSITSTECAYSVFQNAVDLFCSHITHSGTKTNLITSIGAKLGIIPSRCEYLSNEHKPEVIISGSREIKIGRAELSRRTDEGKESDQMLKRNSNDDFNEIGIQKRLRLDKTSHLSVYQQLKRKVPNFSFTKLASCILERISVAVQHDEPVLLVGETGVGKTSSVQYLSFQINHKLVVINMNNQSDVSDLVGGFKPVDLSFVIAPLRSEFEYLFRQTFNAVKNENFLNNISVCYNQEEFNVLVKLMLKIVDSVFQKKANESDKTQKDERLIERWTALKVKLLKLNSQLKNSINLSFAFITGSLVNCIRNGDWVLLDEINLASTETLECLSTILEPNGSIVLLERGDFVPVKRHPDFRIFACMNPSTDIGKKDLPVGIRNRFTEFFVDELTFENDLIILVGDYLRNTGVQQNKILAIVKLYQKLRSMAELDLNDGLGNRPIFSLRTLCRALSICAKNICGSVERNLYESFCLSFLTQLDSASHLRVLDFIQKSLLTNKKAVLSQKIPKPNGDQINFEGYWIQKGPKDVENCENYILTESVKENLRDLARIVSIGKLPVLLQGPTSAGKTSLIEYVAKRSGNYCLRINNHEHTDLQEYIGTYTADVSGKLSFKEGVLVQAMKNGYWIILDELNLAPSDILEALNRVLDDNRELFIPETQELIKAHPNFMLFATQNPPGLYGGRKTLSRAFKNRFIELHFSEIPRSELEVILEKRCLIPKSYAQRMVRTMSELQANQRRENTTKGSFTLRDLFRWGNRYTYANKKLLETRLYDWNQHLVDEGYLVLSSKIRNAHEVEVIETTLYKVFTKKINVENLFSLHDKTSMVTKDLLEAIAHHSEYKNIVWTLNMRRMAVLTGKALEFNEPVLLVGQTGCGKTTICQISSDIAKKQLRILNCHMHTEGADFLGGLRPYRGEQNENNNGTRQLFEWSNGPLILSMTEGSFFLADEISLAEDSVLERLNCVLEPERTILLAEKGGCNESFLDDNSNSHKSGKFVIKANDGFQFLATMNPGGDFGKKELSPALRNRFTEIWCRSIDGREDLIKIAEHSLKVGFGVINQSNVNTLVTDIATTIVDTTLFIKSHINKFNYSIRDILAWVEFITTNSNIIQNSQLSVHESIIFGLETMFLDSLEMLPHESFDEIECQRLTITKYALEQIRSNLQKSLTIEEVKRQKGITIENNAERFGIHPFYINTNIYTISESDFKFTAPTTQNNLFRLLSAMSLSKAILLEGPPGVGKTSIIENLSLSIGYEIVRINLCEHTDLADLFGTDQPSDDNSLEIGSSSTDENGNPNLGSFVWRDGPLLAALKAQNTWILLDELNLAPQSVLEGLNAILDHRGEVYIPELNKTFKLSKQTRIFASQNPLRQGGGRKGLPQSFLNRFTKVYLSKLNATDLLHVINAKYGKYFQNLHDHLISIDIQNAISYFESLEGNIFDCGERMIQFSDRIDNGISHLEFGYKGGPYEVNLRDILRWCDFLSNEHSGYQIKESEMNQSEKYNEFIQILYEKMKLVYCQRMRTDTDKAYIRRIFSEAFHCDSEMLEKKSADISLFWNDNFVYFNDIRLGKNVITDDESIGIPRTKLSIPLMLTHQRESLKALAECVIMECPVLLCGHTDSGKTKLVDIICVLTNRFCNIDTIDDSITGSFQQIDLNRHLEDIAQNVYAFITHFLQASILNDLTSRRKWKTIVQLMQTWEEFNKMNRSQNRIQNQNAMSEELVIFKQRLNRLSNVIETLRGHFSDDKIEPLSFKLSALKTIIQNAETLNTGGHFEWIDSKVVRALKLGQFICLEHVNLCSSAILDRLNSVFETNGKLLLSEKGVSSTAGNQSECVHRHKEFRAFLTLDPKNGEISRAMRNRCLELCVDNDIYSFDDLRQLIYENSVHEIYCIDWLLGIHLCVQKLTEFNNFGVSHLTKFAFLVAENRRLGNDDISAMYAAAMEVYVRSSHIDLLGYGLSYYQNKLIEAITEELKTKPIDKTNYFNFGNIIVHANKLSPLSLIRTQTEPLLTVINCLEAGNDQHKIISVLSSMKSSFGKQKMHLDINSVKYLLYILYEVSSKSDIKLRRLYIEEALSKYIAKSAVKDEKLPRKIAINIKVKDYDSCHNNFESDGQISEYNKLENVSTENYDKIETVTPNEIDFEILLNANKIFANVIDSVKENIDDSLPWNSKIFPRIRDYTIHNSLSTDAQLKTSALLLTHLVISEIKTLNVTKLSQIDAITYSKAVNDHLISNVLDNDMITSIYPLLMTVKEYILSKINASKEFSYEQYTNVAISLLWIERFVTITKTSLFKSKVLNDTLIDKLTLHFNWLSKHLLHLIDSIEIKGSNPNPKSVIFEKHRKQITSFIERNFHPLCELRKKFTKTMTNFVPFYEDGQIIFHENSQLHSKETSLIAKLGYFEKEELIKRFKIVMSEESYEYRKKLFNKISINSMIWLNDIHDEENINETISNCFKNIIKIKPEESIDIDDLTIERKKFEIYCKTMEENTVLDGLSALKLTVSTIPLLEYFVLRSLNSICVAKSNHFHFNEEFFMKIRCLSVDDLKLLKIISNENMKGCEDFWKVVLQSTEENFAELISKVPMNFYRNYSVFMRQIITLLRSLTMKSIALNQEVCFSALDEENGTKTVAMHSLIGPLFTTSVLSALCNANGELKISGLGDLHIQRQTLTSLSSILWNNVELIQNQFDFEKANATISESLAKKLLAEIKIVYSEQIELSENGQFIEQFKELVSNLESLVRDDIIKEDFYKSFLITSLVGAIEVNLYSFMPLLDPVEKNRLKKMYIEEDNQHLEQLIGAYDFMRTIMAYDGLGNAVVNHLDAKKNEFLKWFKKYSKKCALRPEISVYNSLVKDINHFLATCCHPKSLYTLIDTTTNIYNKLHGQNIMFSQTDLISAAEIIKKIDLWTDNADRFENHVLTKYATYYRDFTLPIETSLTTFKFGLIGLKHCLLKERDSFIIKDDEFLKINTNEDISKILSRLVQYPSVHGLNILGNKENGDETHLLSDILGKIENREHVYFSLVKTTIQELKNKFITSQQISDTEFKKFSSALIVVNQIWRDQEETKRKRAMEEDSLYINKTKCETENEDEIVQQEIDDLFPSYINDDFGEFIQNATLEKVPERKVKKSSSKTEILNEGDVKFICNNFIDIMFKYGATEYHKQRTYEWNNEYEENTIEIYRRKLNVFHQLIAKYKTSLHGSIDKSIYNGIALTIGIAQTEIHQLQLEGVYSSHKPYNFYKDPNIAEIHEITSLLDRIEKRVQTELQLWPDHAVLIDIIRIIVKIRDLPFNAPIIRFNTGFQILRQKVDEWNSVAHKMNDLRDLEIEIAQYVQRWTKLELKCWRECLLSTYEKVKSKAYRYWFFIYNLLSEYLENTNSVIPCDLTDFASVEKYIGNNEINDSAAETNEKPKLRTSEIISVLKQYIESSNYAEFELRMQTLKSFEFYLHYTSIGNLKRRKALISIIHNLHIYYSQFSAEIADSICAMRSPIEKKLKEFVKIESYNKDLSYFSMKGNVTRVHKHLHKFLREFETALNGKIASVFVWRANQSPPLVEPNPKGKDINVDDAFMIDVKYFVASHKLKEKYLLDIVNEVPKGEEKSEHLLPRIDKLFTTSRNIVKQAVLHSQFPGLIYSLDAMLKDQIETCEYLRKLEIDRTQEKPRQKSQAKHILQQKRKALADAYKTLTTLGLSFRSGLVETSLQQQLVDLKITPFSIQAMITEDGNHKQIDQTLNKLCENINVYFSKCLFKMKLLQTVMLTPMPELGLPNLERVKGFATDMFLLAQSQRSTLAKSVNEIHQMQKIVKSLNELQIACSEETKDFDELELQYEFIQKSTIQIRDLFEQFDLLLQCVPAAEDKSYAVIVSSNIQTFTRNSPKYKQLRSLTTNIINQCTSLCINIKKCNGVIFHSNISISQISKAFNHIINNMESICSVSKLSADEEILIIIEPIQVLLLEIRNHKFIHANEHNVGERKNIFENINNQLENIVHNILLSMQNIYKKYSLKDQTFYETTETTETTSNAKVFSEIENDNEAENENEIIQSNHLKQKITQEINSDLVILNTSSILKKLSQVIAVIRHADPQNEQRSLSVKRILSIVPILDQYTLIGKFYLMQQLGAHKLSTKLLNVMLTVFVELTAKGFCIPPDLMQDEDGEKNENEDGKEGEGFGMEDGTGEKDVSDKLESEDQLDTARKPGDDNDNEKKEDADCEEENGIDMSEDFDSKLQDVEKRCDDSEESDQSDNEDDLDKQMGETEDGAEKLDDQIWGSDEEKEENEEEEKDVNDEENGKGSKEEDETHNNLDSNNEAKQGGQEDGLDAADNQQKEKKKQDNDIDELNEPDVGEEQPNPYHNELEEPPEPEDIELGDINLDNEENNENDDQRNEENPFDIDKMKDNMEIGEDDEEGNQEEEDENKEDGGKNDPSDSEGSDHEDNTDLKHDDANENDENQEDQQDEEMKDDEPDTQTRGEKEEDTNENETTDEQKNLNEDFQESMDKCSDQENIQSTPENSQKGSTDQVQVEAPEKQEKKDDLDMQDTGEDKEGTGQAENEESETGHQGIADTKETKSNEKQQNKREPNKQRKQGATDEERTISQSENKEKKQLKTMDKTSDEREKSENDDENAEAEEYQHIRDAEKIDRTTMDNATEEQSKNVHHEDNASEDEDDNSDEKNDGLMDVEENNIEDNPQNKENIESEKIESNKESKETGPKGDQAKEKCEVEETEVEGEIIPTYNVPRNDDTTAHCSMDIVQETSTAQEMTNAEFLDMRKMYDKERSSNRILHVQQPDFEMWQSISNKMLPNARELCEQLRLILEPTKCTRLKGDYRTGRRINMKKIIPYIASQFRKDKIWLRRTKPAQRDYKITIAIDDSKSMDYNNSKTMTLQAISLISQALSLLESGTLSIMSFGESPKIILNHNERFEGPKLVSALNFDQNKSRIAELLDFVRIACNEDNSSSTNNGIFENLLLVLSDGRNITSEGEKRVRNAIKLARLQRIFIVYVIVENPENKFSVLDIRKPVFTGDGKMEMVKAYMDTFPFPYYVIVRDLSQLPLVLSDAMRQWFELVSSEQ